MKKILLSSLASAVLVLTATESALAAPIENFATEVAPSSADEARPRRPRRPRRPPVRRRRRLPPLPANQYRVTYYYVESESRYSDLAKDTAVRTMGGEVIAIVPRKFKRLMDIEGTGRLVDGRIVNFAGRVGRDIRYRLVEAPNGIGAGNCLLVPFHTIAVDPSRIPLGTVVRIEETVGLTLPDGTVHDGIWRAEDVGGAIKGQRIDLFLGDDVTGEFLKTGGIGHLQPLTLTVLEGPPEDNCAKPSIAN